MNAKFLVLNKKIIMKMSLIVLVLFFSVSGMMLLARKTVAVSASNKLLPIYSVETDKKQVALTFDCAWGADDIVSIIETLNNNNVKATFFTVGDWVVKNPEAVENLNKAGMEIRQSHFESCTCCAIIV